MGVRELTITQILNSGFEKAAVAFSKFINRTITISNSKSSLTPTDYAYCIEPEKGNLYVLITRIIGDVSGKSFLILSEDETREILATLKGSNHDEVFHEAFLLEIDNIVSAPVVAEIATALGMEIYGDVPQLAKINANELNSFILSEVITEESRSIMTNTIFQFENKNIHPQFIWRLNRKILECVPDQPYNVVGL